MAGLPPQYGSSPFSQYSGTAAYGMPNAAYGYGQGYSGVPFGYLGSIFGGAPTSGSAGNPGKGGGIQAPHQLSGGLGSGTGVQAPHQMPGSPGLASGGGVKAPHKVEGGGQGGGGGLPWTPWFHDYPGGSHGSLSGGTPGLGTGGGVSAPHQLMGGGGLASGNPGKYGFGPYGGPQSFMPYQGSGSASGGRGNQGRA